MSDTVSLGVKRAGDCPEAGSAPDVQEEVLSGVLNMETQRRSRKGSL